MRHPITSHIDGVRQLLLEQGGMQWSLMSWHKAHLMWFKSCPYILPNVQRCDMDLCPETDSLHIVAFYFPFEGIVPFAFCFLTAISNSIATTKKCILHVYVLSSRQRPEVETFTNLNICWSSTRWKVEAPDRVWSAMISTTSWIFWGSNLIQRGNFQKFPKTSGWPGWLVWSIHAALSWSGTMEWQGGKPSRSKGYMRRDIWMTFGWNGRKLLWIDIWIET